MSNFNLSEIVQHPEGKSYQVLTTHHKRGIIVLAEYAKNPKLYFEVMQERDKSFIMDNVTTLEIKAMEFSFDAKYLAVVSGLPDNKIVFINCEKRKLLEGERANIKLTKPGFKKI